MIINDTQVRILEALARYRFLTNRQLVTLGLYKTEKSLREKVLPRLKGTSQPLMKSMDFGFVAGKGRLPQVHYLTKRGALVLAELHQVSLDVIPFFVGAIQFSRDYFHRIEFISLHIAVRQYAQQTGQTVEFFHNYFDSSGNQRQANSQLIRDTQVTLHGKTIIPDGNFRLAMNDGQRRLFSLELHKGNHTKRILAQLTHHAQIVEQGLLADKYQHPFDHYVLSVYDHAGTMQAVKQRFLTTPAFYEHQPGFLFATVEAVETDFAQAWTLANNEPCRFF